MHSKLEVHGNIKYIMRSENTKHPLAIMIPLWPHQEEQSWKCSVWYGIFFQVSVVLGYIKVRK